MFLGTVHDSTGSGAFEQLLRVFHDKVGVNSTPRGIPCRELLNVQIIVAYPSDSAFVTASAPRNAKMAKYLEAEFKLYESGEDKIEEYVKHAKFWAGVTDGERVNSAYGKIVFFDRSLGGPGPKGTTPWEWAKTSLINDRDSRQAVVPYLQPRHYVEGTRDFVCTNHGVFHIRENRLHCTVVMRSNDLVKGFAYDVPWHMRCQMRMRRELGEVGVYVDLGTYTHIVHSLHVYERDVGLVKEMLG